MYHYASHCPGTELSKVKDRERNRSQAAIVAFRSAKVALHSRSERRQSTQYPLEQAAACERLRIFRQQLKSFFAGALVPLCRLPNARARPRMVSGEQTRRWAFLPTMAGVLAARVRTLFSVLAQDRGENAFQNVLCRFYSRAQSTLCQKSHRRNDIVPEIALKNRTLCQKGPPQK